MRLRCPTFQQQEPNIEEFTSRLGKAKDYQYKIELASDLSRIADMFLTCSEYDADSFDCNNCHFISKLRKKAASIIIKAKKLA